MSQAIRFLFDECILASAAVYEQLSASLALFGSDAQLLPFFEKFPLGTKDKDWIPLLASELGWIVITADRGKKSKSDDKLPKICAAFGLTHVMLSRKVAARSWSEKTLVFEANWKELLATADATPGTGFCFYPHGEKYAILKKVSDPPEQPGDQVQRQTNWFESKANDAESPG